MVSTLIERSIQSTVDNDVFECLLSPKFEGANIIDGIGFKHVTYMAEEALLQYFKRKGLSVGTLYKQHGIGFEVVSSSIRIPQLIRLDDDVNVVIEPLQSSNETEQEFSIKMYVEANEVAAHGTIKVVFRRINNTANTVEIPDSVVPFVVPKIDRFSKIKQSLIVPPSNNTEGTNVEEANGEETRDASSLSRDVTDIDESILEQIAPSDDNNFVWKWHIPYFYCHYSKWMQHSGYLRLIEEVVDLFLKDRGISIWSILESHAWIPFVSHSEVDMLQDAFMEETIYTVYTVEKVIKDFLYTSRVDFYVVRQGQLVQTATGKITHGYAQLSDNPEDFGLAQFDQPVLNALNGVS